MKKCPYCAEEIQDEAIYCRYCQHDLTTPQFRAAQPIKNIEGEGNKPQFRLKSVFWPAFGLGLGLGSSLFYYRLSQPMPYPEFGYSGHFNDPLFGGITIFLAVGFLFSLLVFLWRVIGKRNWKLKVISRQSGFASMAAFFCGYILFGIYTASTTEVDPLVARRRALSQPTATQNQASSIPTKTQPTATYHITPTKTYPSATDHTTPTMFPSPTTTEGLASTYSFACFKSNQNIREGAGTDYKVIAKGQKNYCVQILEYNEDKSWVKIKFNDGRSFPSRYITGWVYAPYVDIH